MLFGLAIYVLVAALFWYLVDFLSIPQPFNKILKAIIIVLVAAHVWFALTVGVGPYPSYYYL